MTQTTHAETVLIIGLHVLRKQSLFETREEGCARCTASKVGKISLVVLTTASPIVVFVVLSCGELKDERNGPNRHGLHGLNGPGGD